MSIIGVGISISSWSLVFYDKSERVIGVGMSDRACVSGTKVFDACIASIGIIGVLSLESEAIDDGIFGDSGSRESVGIRERTGSIFLSGDSIT